MKLSHQHAEREQLEVVIRVSPLSGRQSAQQRQRELAVIAKLLQRATALNQQGTRALGNSAAPGRLASSLVSMARNLTLDTAIYIRYTHAMAKVLISMPDQLLTRIDGEAKRRKSSRSAFLQEAARRELGWADPEVIDAAVARAQAALAGTGSFEAVELIRAERDAHDAHDRRGY